MAKEVKTAPGFSYVLTCAQACTVEAIMPDGSTMLLCSREEAGQAVFIGISDKVRVSDDAAQVTQTFKPAAPAAQGGGASIEFDDMPTAGSGNAVTSNGVYVAMQNVGVPKTQPTAICMGSNASSAGPYSVCLGIDAKVTDSWGVAIGSNASASRSCVAVGEYAKANGGRSVAIGYDTIAAKHATALGSGAKARNSGEIFLSTGQADKKTVLCVLGKGSPLSIQYCDGLVGLGFVQKENSKIVSCGTIKLSAVCVDNQLDSDNPFTPDV